MNVSIHQRIRILIEETNDAFACCGAVNADFADFAALALSEFKNVLGNPNLTQEQLIDILRGGMNKHQDKDPNSWSVFMAQHIARAANPVAKTPKTGYSAWKNRVWERESAETA
jgi:hypothetical protein